MKSFSYSIAVIAISMWMVPFGQASEVRDMMSDMNEQVQRDNFLTMVSGIVQDVQGDWFFVEDTQGVEWKIQVDGYTDTIGQVLPGVTIMAMVEPDGHAKEVKVLRN